MTTYTIGKREEEMPPPPPQTLQNMDCLFAVLLLLCFMPRVYLSTDPMKKAASSQSLLTYLSCFSVIWVTFNPIHYYGTFLEGGSVVFLYPFRFWRLHYSLAQVFGPGKQKMFRVSLITQKATLLGLSIFSTLFTVTAWVHGTLYVVQRYYDLTFFDVFYTIAGN